MFIDPSAMASYKTMNKTRMAWMMTPVFQPTKAAGKCMTFSYNIKGLSSKALRVRLYNYEQNTSYILWQKLDSTLGVWRSGHVSFTSDFIHQVCLHDTCPLATIKTTHLITIVCVYFQLVFEAVPNPKNPSNRGHIAVDNIKVTEAACPGLYLRLH